VDVQGLLHNRWFLGAAGLSGVAGLYVLYKRKSAGGSTSQSGGGAGAQASPSYASGSVGSFDSTGTDVANWVGQYSGNLDNQFKEFQKNVADQLAAIPTGSTGTGTPTVANNPAPMAPAEEIYTFRSGDTLAGVASRYGLSQQQLYNFGTNAASLEQYAQWHGLSSSGGGAKVYAGYNIGVPV
jgi:LysM repeat protein